MVDEKEELISVYSSILRLKQMDVLPNSWAWVDDVRTEITTDSDNYPWRESCEELWSFVTEFQNDKELSIHRDDKPTNTPVEALDYWLEIPRYPPLEVLVAISEAFKLYFAAQGSLTLEDVFFGPTKKGVGNYSARKARDDRHGGFHAFVFFERFKADKKGEKIPDLESLAEKYASNQDPESFLRGYRRWLNSDQNKSDKE